MGVVEQVIPSRDGKVRRVIVKYTNGSGSPDYDVTPQFTDRAVRQLVKIFDIEEYMLQEDLAELMRRLVGGEKGDASENNDDATVFQDVNNTPRRNPNYNQTLVEKFRDIKIPHNNTVSKELASSFTLADSQMIFSQHAQAVHLSDFEGLMQLLSCTDVNLY